MATASPSVLYVTSSVPQPLFNLGTDQFGNPQILNDGQNVVMTFDTTQVNVGSGVSFNGPSYFNITANVTYQLTAAATYHGQNFPTDKQPALLWFDTGTGNVIGAPLDINNTVPIYYTPGANTTILVVAAAGSPTSGALWNYPAYLDHQSASITAVSGWTE